MIATSLKLIQTMMLLSMASLKQQHRLLVDLLVMRRWMQVGLVLQPIWHRVF
jgi:hypothetical protein